MDTPDNGNPSAAPDGQKAEPGDDGKPAAETLEALQKRLADKDRYIGELKAAEKAAREAAAQAAQQAQLAKAIEKMADASTQRQGKQDDGDRERERFESAVNELSEAFAEDPKKGAEKAIRLMAAFTEDVRREHDATLKKEKQELLDSFKREAAEIRESIAERDPEYRAVADKVKELAELTGLDPKKDRAALVKLAQREAKTEHPPRGDLPGGEGGRRRAGGSDGGADTPSLAELNKLAEMIGQPPVTQEDYKRMYAGRA